MVRRLALALLVVAPLAAAPGCSSNPPPATNASKPPPTSGDGKSKGNTAEIRLGNVPPPPNTK